MPGDNTTISDAACETFHILRRELSGHTFNYWYYCRSSWGPCSLGCCFVWGRLYTKSVKNKSYRCEMKRGRVKAVGSKGNGLGLINSKSVSGLHLSSSDEALHRDSGSTGTSDVLYLKMAPSLGLFFFTDLHDFHSCLSLWTLLWTVPGWGWAVLKPTAIAPSPLQDLWWSLKFPRAWIINDGSAVEGAAGIDWTRLGGKAGDEGGHGTLTWTLWGDVLTWDLLFPLAPQQERIVP